MAGKGKSKKSSGKKESNNSKKGKRQSIKFSKKSSRCNFDIFNEYAMENAYFTCHNIQDVLKTRGFPWPDAQKKKKKGKY